MSELDMEWVKSQIASAKVRKPVGDAVLKLVQLFDSLELTVPHKEKAIELFSKLGLGHAFIVENKDEKWVPVRPGNIKVSEQVRVKFDAFDGKLGGIHNGRRGVVVGVRYGDVIVKSTDEKLPELDGAHYPPHKLEKLLR
jgi:hypothetical protein